MLANGLRPLARLVLTLGVSIGAARAGEPTGQIRIDAEAGLQVFLDGTPRGATNDAQAGLMLRSVPAGEHRLNIVKRGFGPEEQRLTVSAGQTIVVATFLLRPIETPAPQAPYLTNTPMEVLANARAAIRFAQDEYEFIQRQPMGVVSSSLEFTENLRARTSHLQSASMVVGAARRALQLQNARPAK